MAEHTVVFYLSDEIFARHQPILVTIEAHSTAILKIQLASDRSAETWKAHFDDLGAHRFHSIGMVSDRGRGLVARPAGVGRAVGNAVRRSIVLVAILDFVLSLALWGTTTTVRIAG